MDDSRDKLDALKEDADELVQHAEAFQCAVEEKLDELEDCDAADLDSIDTQELELAEGVIQTIQENGVGTDYRKRNIRALRTALKQMLDADSDYEFMPDHITDFAKRALKQS